MKTLKIALLGSAIALAGAAPVLAASVEATAATDLNVRSGPGAWFDAVGVIPGGEMATIDGCLANGEWCEVTYNGVQGWSYAPYLAVAEEEQYVAMPQSVTVKSVTTIDQEATDQETGAAAIAGGATGALIAYALGGPVGGMVVGGIIGSGAAAASVEPTTETVTYVETNPVEAIWLDGEVVVGAGIPTGIVTYATPQSDVRYLNVNGQTVIVDAETNVIVDVIG